MRKAGFMLSHVMDESTKGRKNSFSLTGRINPTKSELSCLGGAW